MKTERETLLRIESLSEPRHLFIMPPWANPAVIDRLIQGGYLTCLHHQRNQSGEILLLMGLQITEKGERLIHPLADWRQLAWKGSLAGASFTAMSLVILYLG
jgi:hypothetical protein